MHAAHEVFSQRHWETEEVKQALGQAANRLSQLVARRSQVEASLNGLLRNFTQNLASDPGAGIESAKITSAREEAKLLDTAIQQFQLHGHADAERAYLLATVAELESQFASETARLAHHRSKVINLLSEATALDGDIEIKSEGAISSQLRGICASVREALQHARENLRKHDAETTAAREQH